jgi:hypothetical protein
MLRKEYHPAYPVGNAVLAHVGLRVLRMEGSSDGEVGNGVVDAYDVDKQGSRDGHNRVDHTADEYVGDGAARENNAGDRKRTDVVSLARDPLPMDTALE